MKTAYHLINFGCKPDMSEEEKLRAIREVGYDAAEKLTFDPADDPAPVKDLLARVGLRLAALDLPGPLMGMEDAEIETAAKNVARAANALDCDTSVTMVPRTDGKRIHTFGTTEDHYEEAARRLDIAGRILADAGVNLCIHNHIDHMTESMEEMDRLMEGTKAEAVGICFDTAHAVCGGHDPVAYAERYSARIRHLHLKDAKNTLHGRPYFFRNGFLPLGEGIVDFPAVMKALPGYDGWYCVELDGTFSTGQPEKEAAISLAYLRERLG